MKKLLLPLVLLFNGVIFSQITVDETMTTQQLVEDILINGTCASVSNFTQSTGSDFGDVNGIASFDANGSDFPFATGIVLTSGDVSRVPGGNVNLLSDGGNGWPGDADLEANTTAVNTNNASWIQFDFVPLVGEISFDFIMASEEYNQFFECTFSDAFAFILTDQVTGVVQNLAVLPGTTTPIEVTNIREDVPGQCGAVNPEYFDKYNFEPFNIAADAAIDYNGQTVELTAMGPVIVGNPYSIKLVIADQGDNAYDISVYLEGGSFDIGDVDLGIDLTVVDGNARCEGQPYTIVPDLDVPGNTTFEWQFEDPLGSGVFVPFSPPETGPTLEVSTTGNYKIIVDFAGSCTSEGSVLVEFAPPIVVNSNPDTLIKCDSDNDGIVDFPLNDADPDLTLGDPNLAVSYHGTFIDADMDQLPLTIPYTNDDPYDDSVWARVFSLTSSCYEVIELPLEVRDRPVAVTPAEPLRKCDDDGTEDGFTLFDLTVVEPEVLGGMSPVEFDIYYYEDETDAINAGDVALTAPDFSLAIAVPNNYLNTGNPQTLYILVVGNVNSTMPNNGASGCYDIVELELIVDPLPEDFGPFEMMLCDDELNGSTSDDEVSTFDLTSQDAAATGGDATLVVTWYETPADEAANNPIMGPDMYQNTSTPQTVIGRVTTEFDCKRIITLTLTVLPNPSPNTAPSALELCDDDDDGLVGGFLLTDRDAEIIDGEPDVNVLYYEGLQEAIDAVAGTEIVSPYTNITPNTQVVYARVTRDTPPATVPCYSIVELTLNVIALPDMPDATFRDPFLSCDTDGSGQAVFDLTEQDTAVLGVQDAVDFGPITYHPSQVDADMNTNAIDPADAYVSTGGETIWVRLESLVTGCARVTPFDLVVGAFPTIGVGNDLFGCDDELNGSTPDDGISTFDLTVNTPLIDLGDDTLVVEYYATAADQAAGVAIADPTAYQNTVSSPQQEVFVSAFNGEGCAASNSFFLNVEPNPAPLEPTALIACDDDNDGFFADFVLTDKDAEVINGDVDVTVSYYETLVDAQAGDPADMLLSPYANIVPFSQTIYARVVRDVPPGVNPCFAIVPMELRVELLPNPPDPELFLDPMEECDDDADGFAVFDLTRQDNAVLSTQDSPMDFLPVSYHETEADAEAGTNAVPSPDAYTNLGTPQTIWVRAENSLTGCYLVTPFGLVVNPLPVLGTGPFGMAECDDEENGSTPDDGISTFDLTLNNLAITGGDDSYSVSYYLSVADQDSGNAIADPTAHQNMDPITGASINPQDIFVTVFSGPGCEARTDLTLRVLPNPTPSTPQPLQICDGDGDPTVDIDDSDGLSIFDLTQKDAEIINGEPGVGVLYYEDLALAELGDPLDAIVDPTIYENTTPGSQIVYARVTRDVPPGELPCFTIVGLELLVNPLPDGSADIPDLVACEFAADDIAVFDLTERDADALNGQDPPAVHGDLLQEPNGCPDGHCSDTGSNRLSKHGETHSRSS